MNKLDQLNKILSDMNKEECFDVECELAEDGYECDADFNAGDFGFGEFYLAPEIDDAIKFYGDFLISAKKMCVDMGISK